MLKPTNPNAVPQPVMQPVLEVKSQPRDEVRPRVLRIEALEQRVAPAMVDYF